VSEHPRGKHVKIQVTKDQVTIPRWARPLAGRARPQVFKEKR
ncbi:MAG: hypothetical protein QOI78_44, partial [Actinomycetota bacterium]|nr:hypothetical protein [Actinomycetota bacterium]